MKISKSCFVFFIGFAISIIIFLNGFLMNRSEIHKINSCSDDLEYCQYSPYKRIVLLLVDALKYEFVDPTLSQTNYYHGNIDVIRSLNISNKGKYTYLNHFISDPPTTTLQRIKGITTGSLPTFIDISTNFGNSELIEDNIISQWQKSGFDIKFAGDDTWTRLFPGRFNTSQPYPSFNVKDLDSVDRGVEKFLMEHLSNKTQATNKNPEILLGHMLGIDHCGHTYGKNHPQMKRKLNELNNFLKKIIALMDKETLLVVFGDHGMTASGDHGGESEEEVDAAIFVVSEKPLNFHRQTLSEQHELRNLSQIDMVPTLAALTGVAIPFSNLGVIRPEMLTSLGRSNEYLHQNIKQLSQYISSYEHKFGNLHLSSTIHEFLNQSHSNVETTAHSLSILRTIQSHFRSKWAQFNVPRLYSGICSGILHLLCIFSYLLNYQTNSHSDSKLKWRSMFYLLLTFLQLFLNDSYIFVFIFGSLGFLELVSLFRVLVKMLRANDFILALIACAYILVPLSNSFIVSEDRIVQYFLQTILVIKTCQCFLPYLSRLSAQKSKRIDKNKTQSKAGWQLGYFFFILGLFLVGTVSLIFGMSYKICREEQQSWCVSDPNSTSTASFAIFLIPLLLIAHRLWLGHCGNLDSNQFNVINVKYVLPFAGLCLFFHHCMQFVEESSQYIHVANTASLVFPRLAALCSFLSLIFMVINPLLMFHRKKFDNVKRIDVPSLFKYLREKQSDVCESVVVHGLATIYSSAVFSGLLATCVLVSVFLKVQFVLGLLGMLIFLFVYSVLCSQLADCKEANICASLPVWEMGLVMTLLTQYGFFGTGHQATISNIPWYAAFVGWNGDHETQIIPAIMLNINIFSSHILISLFGLVVPLFLLSISVGPVNPFLNQKTKKRDSLTLGDFFLFKGDDEASRFSASLRQYYVVYLALQSTSTLGTIIAAGYGRRHLMAWKIFVPKMMYSVIGLVIVYFITAVGYLIIRRIHRLAIEWRSRNT